MQMELYIKRDSNGRIDKAAKEVRILAKAMGDLYPQLFEDGPDRLWTGVGTGEIVQRRVPLCRVDVAFEGATVLCWNLPLAGKLEINTAMVKEKFRSYSREGKGDVTLTAV